jgi:cytochrome P450
LAKNYFSAVSRVCTKETTLKHLKIEPGTHLQIDILALHTDQTVWGPDSNEFKPERSFLTLIIVPK